MLTQAAGRTELIDGSLPLVDSRMATAPFWLPTFSPREQPRVRFLS